MNKELLDLRESFHNYSQKKPYLEPALNAFIKSLISSNLNDYKIKTQNPEKLKLHIYKKIIIYFNSFSMLNQDPLQKNLDSYSDSENYSNLGYFERYLFSNSLVDTSTKKIKHESVYGITNKPFSLENINEENLEGKKFHNKEEKQLDDQKRNKIPPKFNKMNSTIKDENEYDEISIRINLKEKLNNSKNTGGCNDTSRQASYLAFPNGVDKQFTLKESSMMKIVSEDFKKLNEIAEILYNKISLTTGISFYNLSVTKGTAIENTDESLNYLNTLNETIFSKYLEIKDIYKVKEVSFEIKNQFNKAQHTNPEKSISFIIINLFKELSKFAVYLIENEIWFICIVLYLVYLLLVSI